MVTGKLKRVPNTGQPWVRPKETPPPCAECPKGGPQNEKRYALNSRQEAALSCFRAMSAGLALPEGSINDLVVRAWIDAIQPAWEAAKQGARLVPRKPKES